MLWQRERLMSMLSQMGRGKERGRTDMQLLVLHARGCILGIINCIPCIMVQVRYDLSMGFSGILMCTSDAVAVSLSRSRVLLILNATKAASDAWKSMSVEEKERYTKRAREMWDNYLSNAPARSPRRRKQTKLVTRCSPGRVFNVMQHLTMEQKDAVRSMGFGSLLGLRCRTLRPSLCLCYWRDLTPQDAAWRFVEASGKDVINSGPDDLIAGLRRSYSATNRGISLRLLEERLKDPEAGEGFKRSFVLYALGTLVSPTARLDVSPSFLHFLTRQIWMYVIHQYNRGKFLLDRLVREVPRFHQGKQRAVLQTFANPYLNASIYMYPKMDPVLQPFLLLVFLLGERKRLQNKKNEKESVVTMNAASSVPVVWKERSIGMELAEYGGESDGRQADKLNTEVEHCPVFEQEGSQINMESLLTRENVVDGDIEIAPESVETVCQSKEYDYDGTLDYTNNNVHEEVYIFSTCACPVLDCNFVGGISIDFLLIPFRFLGPSGQLDL
ncbi:hypothetical protein Tsubulata_027864, partial [Turnera subulata]